VSAPSFSVPDQIPDIDLRRFLLMLWRRKWIMYGSLVVGLVLTILIVSMLPVQYSAKTLVLLEPSYVSRTSVPETQIVLNPSKTETSLVLSELEVIRSTTLAREVVRRLNLVRDPEFNRALRSSHSWGRGAQVSSFRPLSVQGDTLGSIPAETIDAQMADIIARFQEGLRVRLISGSHALQIEYTALTPAKAARIANTIADIYIEQRLDSKFQFTKKTTEWLDKRLETLRGQVRAHEEAAARYRARHNLAEGKQALASAEQFSQLNAQLALAKTQSWSISVLFLRRRPWKACRNLPIRGCWGI
jgi:succinoglycan biosynthesis transport protein ExoP